MTAGHSFCPWCQDLAKDAEGVTWSLIEHNRSLKTRWRPAARGGRPGVISGGTWTPSLLMTFGCLRQWSGCQLLEKSWSFIKLPLSTCQNPQHTNTHTHTEFPIGPLLAVCVRTVEELFAPSFPAGWVYSRVKTSHMTWRLSPLSVTKYRLWFLHFHFFLLSVSSYIIRFVPDVHIHGKLDQNYSWSHHVIFLPD